MLIIIVDAPGAGPILASHMGVDWSETPNIMGRHEDVANRSDVVRLTVIVDTGGQKDFVFIPNCVVFVGNPNVGTIDLDMDSDNTGPFAGPDYSDAEDKIEEDPPGKVIVANSKDSDTDNIPGFADFDSNDQFIPLVLTIPQIVGALDYYTIELTYNASDPAAVAEQPPGTYTPAPGTLRIWKKNGNVVRDKRAANALVANERGDYVPSGSYMLDQLGPMDANRRITLYVEAVQPGVTTPMQRIRAELMYNVFTGPVSQGPDSVLVTISPPDVLRVFPACDFFSTDYEGDLSTYLNGVKVACDWRVWESDGTSVKVNNVAAPNWTVNHDTVRLKTDDQHSANMDRVTIYAMIHGLDPPPEPGMQEGDDPAKETEMKFTIVKIDIVCNVLLEQDEAIPNPGAIFSLEFSPAAAANSAVAYGWAAAYQEPNVNNPAFPFKTPKAATTGVSDYRWYGHGDVPDDNANYLAPAGGEDDNSLRWTGNCMEICSYEIKCYVTFQRSIVAGAIKPTDSHPDGKYFHVTVNDGGSTLSPSILNLRFFGRALGEDGKWKVTGKGNMLRQDAVFTRMPLPSSQFYNQTHTHEQTHTDHYNAKNGQGEFLYFDVDVFYNRIKDFESDSKDDLEDMVVNEYNDYFDEMVTAIGTEESQELEAYHSEYNVDPKGVRERSDTWIKNRY